MSDRSLFTYRITKKVSRKKDAVLLAFALPKGQFFKTGPREWVVSAWIRDTDLEVWQPYLGEQYGSETFLT